MKPCPEVIRPAGRTGAQGKEAVERKQFYQVEIARRFHAGGFFISAREAQDELAAPIEAKEPVVWLRRRPLLAIDTKGLLLSGSFTDGIADAIAVHSHVD